jgi:ATP-dependent DNA helicase RecG
MESLHLTQLLEDLLKQPSENEWIEFKENNDNPEQIGEYISALSNGAGLRDKPFGYLVFGVNDGSKEVVGTSFEPHKTKKGNEDLIHWLIQRLEPRIDFRFFTLLYNNKPVVLCQIPAADNQPVDFLHIPYIRIHSVKRKLSDFPEKERKIWQKRTCRQFESEVAMMNVSAADIIRLLDTQVYFDLMKLPYPTNQAAVIERFEQEGFVVKNIIDYAITNIGGLLFAKNLAEFSTLSRKAMRVIVYEGKNKLKTIRDSFGNKGYAVGFEGLIQFVSVQLPSNEEIKKALREVVRVYPEIAIRELVANALIHQDFFETGTGPMLEIYTDRIEISNPGLPIIKPLRFIDEYKSRNEKLADIMRRLRICEEKGSGIDKVVSAVEMFQLPAPKFEEQLLHTKAILYAPVKFNEMNKEDKIRACYQHCVLRYVSNEKMTNQTIRERFQIDDRNYPMASKIIRETIDSGFIKEEDPENKSKKFTRYVPYWA